MEFQYRDGKPILPVQISGSAEKISLIGILDSGADYCTAPRAICEELLNTVREQEIYIPGGTLMLPVFKGAMAVGGMGKEVEIIGVDLHPRLNIDCLVGRVFFGTMDIHLLGKSSKLVLG
ncbi:MAG: hypothetical protein GWP10_06250 [Nitrospiraceae bacterium]|nr:hypothetical protein [Nitrospiraceae bacterium]